MKHRTCIENFPLMSKALWKSRALCKNIVVCAQTMNKILWWSEGLWIKITMYI